METVLIEMAQTVGRVEGYVQALQGQLRDLAEEDRAMHEKLDRQLDLLSRHVQSLDVQAAAKKVVRRWAGLAGGAVGGVLVAIGEIARAMGWF